MTIKQRLDLEREDRRHEGALARLGGRGKFNFCSICGNIDGMNSVHQEMLAQLNAGIVTRLAPWYRQPGNSKYLFHACDRCNRQGVIPAGYERVRIIDIPAWLDDNPDPMVPDYEALRSRFWRH